MEDFSEQTPVVMTFANHDPSGSSGIQADIETCSSLGCHCTAVITALCAKDTHDLKDMITIDTTMLIEQSRAILEDMPVRAIKIGFLGSVDNAEAVHTILRDYPDIPVVLDPVTHLVEQPGNNDALMNALQSLLLSSATIVTPDLVEAYDLAPQADTLDACAMEILESGCQHILVTGSKRSQNNIENNFYDAQGLRKRFQYPRLKFFSHGCGSTLSTSITAYLAHGLRLQDAVEQGQNFTWNALSACRRLGMGRRIPNRFFWTDNNDSQQPL